MVIEGAKTGETFLAYVEQCLVPTLRRNDIVVMDNCRVHMAPAIREAIKKARATLRYLPKYFPDLNSIEMSYGKFKRFSARWQRDLFRASREQFARSHNSDLTNVPTISVAPPPLYRGRMDRRKVKSPSSTRQTPDVRPAQD